MNVFAKRVVAQDSLRQIHRAHKLLLLLSDGGQRLEHPQVLLAIVSSLIVDPGFVTSLHKFASIQRDGLLVEADAPVEIALPPGCFAVSNQTVDLFSVDRVREFRA